MNIKSIFSFFLAIVILSMYALSGFPVKGSEPNCEIMGISLIYNGTINKVDVLVDSEKNIFMDTETISRYTPFTYVHEKNTFYYDGYNNEGNITKEISIDIYYNKAIITNRLFSVTPVVIEQQLLNVYQKKGKFYLPVAEILPCLDTYMEIVDGKLIIMPVASTTSHALNNINIDDYLFDMYYSETKKAEFISTLYEDLSHLRISRIPIIRSTFRYTEINNFKDIFTDYLLDDSVYVNAMNKVLDSKEIIAKSLISNLDEYKKDLDTSKFFYLPPWIATTVIDVNAIDECDKWGFDEKFGKQLGRIENGYDGLYDAVSVYTAYQFHITDHLCMLNAVYDLEESSHKYKTFMSKSQTEAHAAKKIYEKYSNGLFEALLTSMCDTIFNNLADVLVEKTSDAFLKLINVKFNSFFIDMERAVINKFFPEFTTTSKNFEILPYHYKVANTALSDYYSNRIVNQDGINYGERINSSRLRLILYLTSSKYCYKAIQSSNAAYKNQGIVNSCEKRINQINELLSKLYLAAFSIECDSYDRIDETIKANCQSLKDIKLSKPINAFELYKQYFEEHFELTDLVCLADVTHDGIDEMIVVTEREGKSEPKFSGIINGLIYSISNEEVTLIHEIHGGASHAPGFFDLRLIQDDIYFNIGDEMHGMWQGRGELRYEEYYINADGEIEHKFVLSTNDIDIPNDSDGSISTARFKKYVELLNQRIENSYVLYSNFSESTVEAKPIETNPTIVLGIGTEKKSNLVQPTQAPYIAYKGYTVSDGAVVMPLVSSNAKYVKLLPDTEVTVIYEDKKKVKSYYLIRYGKNEASYGYTESCNIHINSEPITLNDTRFYVPLAEYLYTSHAGFVRGCYTGLFDVDFDEPYDKDNIKSFHHRVLDGNSKSDLLKIIHESFSSKYDDYERLIYTYGEESIGGSVNDCFSEYSELYKEKDGKIYKYSSYFPKYLFLESISMNYLKTEGNEVWFSMKANWGTTLECEFSMLLENNKWKIGAAKYPC